MDSDESSLLARLALECPRGASAEAHSAVTGLWHGYDGRPQGARLFCAIWEPDEQIYRSRFSRSAAQVAYDTARARPEGNSWFQSASGRPIYIDRPDPAAVHIEDIAHALARICRFGGHLKVEHYSVAQHSEGVSRVCKPAHALLGLLHDSAEAYVGDMIRPLKQLLPAYKEIERGWERAIGERFGLGDQLANLPADIKEADEIMLATERRDLLSDGPGHRRWTLNRPPLVATILPMPVRVAQHMFMARYHELLKLSRAA